VRASVACFFWRPAGAGEGGPARTCSGASQLPTSAGAQATRPLPCGAVLLSESLLCHADISRRVGSIEVAHVRQLLKLRQLLITGGDLPEMLRSDEIAHAR
jgi:hypothetical protein